MLLKAQCLAAYNNKNGIESLQKSLGEVAMPAGERIMPYMTKDEISENSKAVPKTRKSRKRKLEKRDINLLGMKIEKSDEAPNNQPELEKSETDHLNESILGWIKKVPYLTIN